MTRKPKTAPDALDQLADALVDDILETPDEDILAEVIEDGGDPQKVSEEMCALFERTVQELSRANLEAAKKAAADARKAAGVVVPIDPAEARRLYDAMIANDPELSAKLTMAARKGEDQSDRDIESTIEDLAELGAFDADDEDSD